MLPPRTGEATSSARSNFDLDRSLSRAGAPRAPGARAELEVLRRARDLASEVGDSVPQAWLGALRGSRTQGDELRLASVRRSGGTSRGAAIDRILAIDPTAVPIADEQAVVKEARMRELLRRHRVTLRALTARSSGPGARGI